MVVNKLDKLVLAIGITAGVIITGLSSTYKRQERTPAWNHMKVIEEDCYLFNF